MDRALQVNAPVTEADVPEGVPVSVEGVTEAEITKSPTARLREGLENLSPKSREFAESLLAWSERRTLSSKQEFWIKKLASEAHGLRISPTADMGPGTFTEAFGPIIERFDYAREHGLKWPKLTLRVYHDQPRQNSFDRDYMDLTLSAAGRASANAGGIYVKEGMKYLGKVTKDGKWYPAYKGVNDEMKLRSTACLKAFSKDPARIAGESGRLTGNCSMCRRPLKDERSLAVGYGKTCSEHYNMPWGNKDQVSV